MVRRTRQLCHGNDRNHLVTSPRASEQRSCSPAVRASRWGRPRSNAFLLLLDFRVRVRIVTNCRCFRSTPECPRVGAARLARSTAGRRGSLGRAAWPKSPVAPAVIAMARRCPSPERKPCESYYASMTVITFGNPRGHPLPASLIWCRATLTRLPCSLSPGR
jgi:hypothetical protein